MVTIIRIDMGYSFDNVDNSDNVVAAVSSPKSMNPIVLVSSSVAHFGLCPFKELSV